MDWQKACGLTGSRNNQKIRFGVPEGEEGGGVITVRCGREDGEMCSEPPLSRSPRLVRPVYASEHNIGRLPLKTNTGGTFKTPYYTISFVFYP